MKDNSGKIILALLAGASAGIVAGLLMAPDSGTVSRDNLKKYAGKLSKDMEKAVQDNLGKLSSINTGAILESLGLSKLAGGTNAGQADNGGEGSSAYGRSASEASSNAPGSAYGRSGSEASSNAPGSAYGRSASEGNAGANAPKPKPAGSINPNAGGPDIAPGA